MPLARIRTRYPERVSDVAATLMAAGYTVETAHPSETKTRQAEVELWIDDPEGGQPQETALTPPPTKAPRRAERAIHASGNVAGRLIRWADHGLKLGRQAYLWVVDSTRAWQSKRHRGLPSVQNSAPLGADSVPVETAVVVEELVAMPLPVPAPRMEEAEANEAAVGPPSQMPTAIAPARKSPPTWSRMAEECAARAPRYREAAIAWAKRAVASAKPAGTWFRHVAERGAVAMRSGRRRLGAEWLRVRRAHAAGNMMSRLRLDTALAMSRMKARSAPGKARRVWTRREREWAASGIAAGILAFGFAIGWHAAMRSNRGAPPSATSSSVIEEAIASPAKVEPVSAVSKTAEPATPAATPAAGIVSADVPVKATKRRVRPVVGDDEEDVVIIHYPPRAKPKQVQSTTYDIPRYTDLN